MVVLLARICCASLPSAFITHTRWLWSPDPATYAILAPSGEKVGASHLVFATFEEHDGTTATDVDAVQRLIGGEHHARPVGRDRGARNPGLPLGHLRLGPVGVQDEQAQCVPTLGHHLVATDRAA